MIPDERRRRSQASTKRAAAWLVRAVGLYLAWDIAYLVAAGARFDEPELSLIRAFLPGVVKLIWL